MQEAQQCAAGSNTTSSGLDVVMPAEDLGCDMGMSATGTTLGGGIGSTYMLLEVVWKKTMCVSAPQQWHPGKN